MWSAQAEAEGLTLLVAETKTGYFGVHLNNPGKPKPYTAQVRRGGNQVSLGSFATAEEVALCVARSLLQPPQGVVAGFSSEAELRAEAKKAEAWAQHVQNDEVDGWSMELGVSWIVQ